MRTIVLVSGQDWHFLSHRLELAKAARAAGYRVLAVVPPGDRVDEIRAHGFEVEIIPISRNFKSPLMDLLAIWRVHRLCRQRNVALVHAFALKPILIAALAALLPGSPALVATVSGMGYLFMRAGAKARLIRWGLTTAFRFLLDRRGRMTIVQNHDDLAACFVSNPQHVRLVRGSGVDPDFWFFTPEPETGPPVAVLPARALWDKGLGEMVEAARLLKARNIPVRVVLVGDGDPANPRNIPREQLEAWAAEGAIEWWGHQSDMRDVWKQAHMAVLPSYREGLPKALLEAASCGRPLIATDVPGCRELVEDGANGLLVPARSAEPLADAIERLALSPELRERLGAEARRRVVVEFSSDVVNGAIIATYDNLLGNCGSAVA